MSVAAVNPPDSLTCSAWLRTVRLGHSICNVCRQAGCMILLNSSRPRLVPDHERFPLRPVKILQGLDEPRLTDRVLGQLAVGKHPQLGVRLLLIRLLL